MSTEGAGGGGERFADPEPAVLLLSDPAETTGLGGRVLRSAFQARCVTHLLWDRGMPLNLSFLTTLSECKGVSVLCCSLIYLWFYSGSLWVFFMPSVSLSSQHLTAWMCLGNSGWLVRVIADIMEHLPHALQISLRILTPTREVGL